MKTSSKLTIVTVMSVTLVSIVLAFSTSSDQHNPHISTPSPNTVMDYIQQISKGTRNEREMRLLKSKSTVEDQLSQLYTQIEARESTEEQQKSLTRLVMTLSYPLTWDLKAEIAKENDEQNQESLPSSPQANSIQSNGNDLKTSFESSSQGIDGYGSQSQEKDDSQSRYGDAAFLKEERDWVAKCHWYLAKLHMSKVLPLFEAKPQKTSIYYWKESEMTEAMEKWREDWMIDLLMALDEDYALNLEVYEGSKHFLPWNTALPLNLPAALFHLNAASLLGHSSSQSMFALLTKQALRGQSPSRILPDASIFPQLMLAKSSQNSQDSRETSSQEIHDQTTEEHVDNHQQVRDLVLVKKNFTAAHWISLNRFYQEMAGGDKSAGSLLSEAYQYLYGLDSMPNHCNYARQSYESLGNEFFKLYSSKFPMPMFGDFEDSSYQTQLLLHQHTSQALGAYHESNEFEKEDIIQYYKYLSETSDHPNSALGLLYLYGTEGISRDYDEALRYFKKANQEKPSSSLAYMIQMGIGTPADPLKARDIYHHASLKNDSFALTALGYIFLHGNPEMKVAQDHKKAIHYFSRAAAKDYLDAHFRLAILYQHGLGTVLQPNPSKAATHLFSAAHLGHPGALAMLAAVSRRCDDASLKYRKMFGKLVFGPIAKRALDLHSFEQVAEANVLFHILSSMGHDSSQLNAAFLAESNDFASEGQFLTLQDLTNLNWMNGLGIKKSFDNIQIPSSSYQHLPSSSTQTISSQDPLYPATVQLNPKDIYYAYYTHFLKLSLASLLSYSAWIEPVYSGMSFKSIIDHHPHALDQLKHQPWLHQSYDFSLENLYEFSNSIDMETSPEARMFPHSSSLSSNIELSKQSHNHHGQHHDATSSSYSHLSDEHIASHYNQDLLKGSFELYLLAAQQNQPEAMLKVGDAFYHGIGTGVSYNSSVHFYTMASSLKHAQAAFNLGYMHQRGIGVPKDFHLAKRYYDTALQYTNDAYLPVSLALIGLSIEEYILSSISMTNNNGNQSPIGNLFSFWKDPLSLLGFLVILALTTVIVKWRIRMYYEGIVEAQHQQADGAGLEIPAGVNA